MLHKVRAGEASGGAGRRGESASVEREREPEGAQRPTGWSALVGTAWWSALAEGRAEGERQVTGPPWSGGRAARREGVGRSVGSTSVGGPWPARRVCPGRRPVTATVGVTVTGTGGPVPVPAADGTRAELRLTEPQIRLTTRAVAGFALKVARGSAAARRGVDRSESLTRHPCAGVSVEKNWRDGTREGGGMGGA
jgi:uncharacterized protein (DUF1684 family)